MKKLRSFQGAKISPWTEVQDESVTSSIIPMPLPNRVSININFIDWKYEKNVSTTWRKGANLIYKYGNRHFWCRGYYVDTVGKNTAAIKAYIQNQIKEDLEYDQMSLVEYIDPLTGEPVKKNKK